MALSRVGKGIGFKITTNSILTGTFKLYGIK